MRARLASGEPGALLAIDYFVEQVLRELAAMAAALRGIDILVFAGGIGENAGMLRERVVEGAHWLGSAVEARVMHADEGAVIARHTARVAAS